MIVPAGTVADEAYDGAASRSAMKSSLVHYSTPCVLRAWIWLELLDSSFSREWKSTCRSLYPMQ